MYFSNDTIVSTIFIFKRFEFTCHFIYLEQIWVKRAILEMPKSVGGLALPNFILYYWAANTSKLSYWITSFSTGQSPTWVAMESETCPSFSPLPNLCISFSKTSNFFSSNPVVKHSPRIWHQFRKHLNPSHTVQVALCLWFAQTDLTFSSWYDSDIVFKDLSHLIWDVA